MSETARPNPFSVLGLPTSATSDQIGQRVQERVDLARSEEERQLHRWAAAELLSHADRRLRHELFEVPDADHENALLEAFMRAHRRNPFDLATLARKAPPPGASDFRLPDASGPSTDHPLSMRERKPESAMVTPLTTAADGTTHSLGIRDVLFG